MILLSQRPRVIEDCTRAAGFRVPSVACWIPARVVTCDLLIVDAGSLMYSERKLLQVFSRRPARPPILLVDDDSLKREELGLIVVEYVVREGDIAQLRHAIHLLSRFGVAQSCGQLLADHFDSIPPLKDVVRLLFTAAPPVTRVRALAAAIGVPERTLRSRWRTATPGTVRLSELTRGVARALSEDMLPAEALDALCTLCVKVGCHPTAVEQLRRDRDPVD